MSNDFSIFDGQELVTYSSAGGTIIDHVPALRRPLTQSRQRNVERYVMLQATDVIFYFDASFLEAISVAAGDTFMDQYGVTFNVLFIEHQSLNRTLAVVGRPVV